MDAVAASRLEPVLDCEAGNAPELAVRERLAKHGFVEERNLRIDSRFVPYGSRPNIDAARELIALKPDAILACKL